MNNTAQTNPQLAEVAKLIEHQRVAMLATFTPNGDIETRPMTVIEFDGDGVFWFFVRHDAADTADAARYARVNLAFVDVRKANYVSINGSGTLVQDRQRLHDYWTSLAKPWFPEGPDSPTLALLRVIPDRAEFWDSPDNRIVRSLAMAASVAANRPIGLGEHGVVNVTPASHADRG